MDFACICYFDGTPYFGLVNSLYSRLAKLISYLSDFVKVTTVIRSKVDYTCIVPRVSAVGVSSSLRVLKGLFRYTILIMPSVTVKMSSQLAR